METIISMNLYCEGIYEVPIQMGTWESYLVYSDKDGGNLGVAKRLRYYYLYRLQQDSLKYRNSPEELQDNIEYWTELIHTLDNAIANYKEQKRVRKLNFGIL